MTIPTDYTFVATYTSTINAEKGSGNLLATAFGGAAIASGILDLAHDDVRYLTYSATNNADSQQVGTIRFTVVPNYSGVPLHDNVFVTITEADGNPNNRIQLLHDTAGNLEIGINDSTGAPIVSGTHFWFPTSGEEYEIELDYSLTTGNTRLFIDGRVVFSDLVSTGTRSSSIGLLGVGVSWDSISTPATNFKIGGFIIYNAVQHTANYTPGYCLGWALEALPTIINVFGFTKDLENVGQQQIRVHVSAASVFEYSNLEIYKIDVETLSGTDGYWTIPLIENTSTNVRYTFSFYLNNTLLKQYQNIIIPTSPGCVAFTDII